MMGVKLNKIVWNKNTVFPFVEVGLNLQMPLEISCTIVEVFPDIMLAFIFTVNENSNCRIIFKRQYFCITRYGGTIAFFNTNLGAKSHFGKMVLLCLEKPESECQLNRLPDFQLFYIQLPTWKSCLEGLILRIKRYLKVVKVCTIL